VLKEVVGAQKLKKKVKKKGLTERERRENEYDMFRPGILQLFLSSNCV